MSEPASLVITGSSGFIGTELRKTIAAGSRYRSISVDVVPGVAVPGERFHQVNICSTAELGDVTRTAGTPRTVVHLAAQAEAVTPWRAIGDLFDTNVTAVWTLLETLRPERVIFASSCAVYGNALDPPAAPQWDNVRPVGLYGLSKAVAERVIREWVERGHGSAVILRFGNVIGQTCRGLIPYLVRHALDHPGTPAQMRGQGRIVRDYVPVQHVVGTILAAARDEWPDHSLRIYNVGTGRGTSNGEVAHLVQQVLGRRGVGLRIRFDHPLARGEAEGTVLDVERTIRDFHLPLPDRGDVERAVESSVEAHLVRAGSLA